jgi:hypothetical protein
MGKNGGKLLFLNCGRGDPEKGLPEKLKSTPGKPRGIFNINGITS